LGLKGFFELVMLIRLQYGQEKSISVDIFFFFPFGFSFAFAFLFVLAKTKILQS
jgi:hypothetical protein